MEFAPLYSKGSKGEVRVWNVSTEGNSIIVKHGVLDGKIQTKVTYAEAKNVGRSNETTPEQQACLEAEAKHTLQLKRGYYLTKEEALSSVPTDPMKCQDYKNFSHKLKYPCYVQPKLNGLRCMIDKNGQAWSKAGEPYKLPVHIQKDVDYLASIGAIPHGIDGEIYAGLESQGGLSLQRIVSAFRKENGDTHKLHLCVYDIPVEGVPAIRRMHTLIEMPCLAEDRPNVNIVATHVVESQEDYDSLHEWFVKDGFEGTVARNMDGMYEHGKRSYDMLKRKPRADAEAQVISVEADKNGQGILLCEAVNGEQKGVRFKCLALKNIDSEINYRLYDNALLLIGKHITYQYEELSDSLTPTKPTCIGVREVLKDGEARF